MLKRAVKQGFQMILKKVLEPRPKYYINLTEIALQSIATQRYHCSFALFIDSQYQKNSIDVIAMSDTFLDEFDKELKARLK